ncbi:MAG: hypothetical protein GYA21_08070 [Myxococcales bacterium]|nr:hypothetical protein [Myxococcales bacterium]
MTRGFRQPLRRILAALALSSVLSPPMSHAREPAPAPGSEAKAGAVRVYRFDNLDIEGHIKNPHLMYFLKRVKNSFRTFRLPEQKFTQDVIRTRNADFL